ncbi:ECF-type sigma factor [Acanthopleuribacter pedis]|uniref:Sigma-70 family RNA polymerase sigma factor n=1 Tax=Acanthopleuribacter pedis TaxID=442870 RepID=A0A8J7QMP1_9BACT|nr:ECF-type sigma factor [Acanthopleuribacter pedis]MBO1321218.1 sigma-70 family RNA polymerase sigma factor [Acanthopleuribacter pedis]
MTPPTQEITQLLRDWRDSVPGSESHLMELVYPELKQIAAAYLKQESRNNLPTTSSLVHEAYLRLVSTRTEDWQSRVHFFGFAARCMRQILIAWARQKLTKKRGAGQDWETYDDFELVSCSRPRAWLQLDDAMNALEDYNQRMGRIAELRYFGGLTLDEIAEHLDVSPATIKRDWKFAKAWLYQRLKC